MCSDYNFKAIEKKWQNFFIFHFLGVLLKMFPGGRRESGGMLGVEIHPVLTVAVNLTVLYHRRGPAVVSSTLLQALGRSLPLS